MGVGGDSSGPGRRDRRAGRRGAARGAGGRVRARVRPARALPRPALLNGSGGAHAARRRRQVLPRGHRCVCSSAPRLPPASPPRRLASCALRDSYSLLSYPYASPAGGEATTGCAVLTGSGRVLYVSNVQLPKQRSVAELPPRALHATMTQPQPQQAGRQPVCSLPSACWTILVRERLIGALMAIGSELYLCESGGASATLLVRLCLCLWLSLRVLVRCAALLTPLRSGPVRSSVRRLVHCTLRRRCRAVRREAPAPARA